MSSRSWLPNAPLGVGLIIALSLGAVALSNYQRKANDAYQAAHQDYEHSKRIVTADAAAPRPYTGDKTFREEWRAEQDLEAQRQMAEWAFWMLMATSIGVGVTFAGVIYVKRTLEMNRELLKQTAIAAGASKASADALVSAERSHLFVRVTLQSLQDAITRASMWGRDMDEGHIEPRLCVRYVIKNFGKTPAILREINHTLVVLANLPVEPRYSDPRGLPYQRVLAGGDETPEIECVCATWTTVEMARKISSGEVPFWFFGRVVYEDVITGAEHVEPFLYVYAGAGFNADHRPAYNQRT